MMSQTFIFDPIYHVFCTFIPLKSKDWRICHLGYKRCSALLNCMPGKMCGGKRLNKMRQINSTCMNWYLHTVSFRHETIEKRNAFIFCDIKGNNSECTFIKVEIKID